MANREPHPLKITGQADWVFFDALVREALLQAWCDSQPGVSGGHEEGGFILIDEQNNLSVSRWAKGGQDKIIPPPCQNCQFEDKDIVATFHTHPNTGNNYLQEPSESDKRAVKDDPDLKGKDYEGEFVISEEKIYLITPNGSVIELGKTEKLLYW